MKKLEIKAGDRYGRLTIIREVERHIRPTGISIRTFELECDCGKKINLPLGHIVSGHTISCGCFKSYTTSKIFKIHGEASGKFRTTEYRTWAHMKERCLNSKNKDFHYYGGRGIRVCDRWIDSYENFLSDMGRKPSPEYSIDRINNDGNYEPSNCRWATKQEQTFNQRPRTYKNKSKEIA